MSKLSSVKFRCCVPRPEHAMSSQSALHDTFAAPEYEIAEAGPWLRITHVQSGKTRRYPVALCMGADEAPQEAQLRPVHGQGGRR